MTIERTINGMWTFTHLVGDRLVTRRYLGYPKKQAERLFREEIRVLGTAGKRRETVSLPQNLNDSKDTVSKVNNRTKQKGE
jgi:hypothetical protein